MNKFTYYDRELCRVIAVLEALTNQMFHVKYPELNHHYERMIETRNAKTAMLLYNEVCRRIDALNELGGAE